LYVLNIPCQAGRDVFLVQNLIMRTFNSVINRIKLASGKSTYPVLCLLWAFYSRRERVFCSLHFGSRALMAVCCNNNSVLMKKFPVLRPGSVLTPKMSRQQAARSCIKFQLLSIFIPNRLRTCPTRKPVRRLKLCFRFHFYFSMKMVMHLHFLFYRTGSKKVTQ